jgi:hypothetical protein
MLRTGAGRLAETDRLPTSLRAVLGHYADTGEFDWESLRLKRRVDDVTEAMIDEAFEAIERRLTTEFGHDDVSFAYDTKLVLPAQLTLGYLYRRLDPSDHDRAEAMTRLAIETLIDGDMRDAINDDEFEDFEVDFHHGDPRRVARLAQQTLEDRVESGFADHPDAVRDAYDWAVDVSEAHQDEDDHFRELMTAADESTDSSGREPRQEARERIREEYKYVSFADPPDGFTSEELNLPYVKTQYDRVGVIYDGMIGMYRAADLPVEDAFKKSIVLAIIGAQLWLDDVDDYAVDMQEGQLTPVTAEYVLADSQQTAYERVVDISERYLDLATDHASAADSTLTGIATEYIYRSGTPERLPH